MIERSIDYKSNRYRRTLRGSLLLVSGLMLAACSGSQDSGAHSPETAPVQAELREREATDGAARLVMMASAELPEGDFSCVIDLAEEGFANSASSITVVSGALVLEHRWDAGSSQYSPVIEGDIPNLEVIGIDSDYASRFESPGQYSYGDMSDTGQRVYMIPGTEATLYADANATGAELTVDC